MSEAFRILEHLTEDDQEAKSLWRHIVRELTILGRDDILKTPRVLDLGSGRSVFSGMLSNLGIDCTSVEIKNIDGGVKEKRVQGDIAALPFMDKTFDILHARGALDSLIYQHDYAAVFCEAARVLKPRGILAVYDIQNFYESDFKKYFIKLKINDNYLALFEKIS